MRRIRQRREDPVYDEEPELEGEEREDVQYEYYSGMLDDVGTVRNLFTSLIT